MVVVGRSPQGSYRLAELDGAVSRTSFAAFRVIPYHAREAIQIADNSDWETEPVPDGLVGEEATAEEAVESSDSEGGRE